MKTIFENYFCDFNNINYSELETDCLIFGVYEKEQDSCCSVNNNSNNNGCSCNGNIDCCNKLKELNLKLNNEILELIKLEDFKPKLGSLLLINTPSKIKAKRVLLVGLGKKSELTEINQVRKAVSKAIRKAKSLKAKIVTVKILRLDNGDLEINSLARAITETCLIAPYSCASKYKTKSPQELAENSEDSQDQEIEKIILLLDNKHKTEKIEEFMDF